MNKKTLTHCVAVNSYLIRDNQFLLLKRANQPLIWGPPGGRLLSNEDPVVVITSPGDGSTFQAGDAILFEGTADDPEDGLLSGTDVRWNSSLDGQFGTGTSLSFSSVIFPLILPAW